MKMIYIPNEEHNPRLNLAMETYLLEEKDWDESVVFFYINSPSVIIGRNQNTIEEINEEYIKEHHIDVVRRMSGGGAVYHDFGNLNFSFILPSSDHFMDFETLTAPIVKAIRDLGVEDVHLSGRNDLLIGDRKFSGNAMYKKKNRIVCHGTLLFNSDLTVVNDALKVDPSKLKTKGIRSVKSRVTNILPHLPKEKQNLTTEQFRDEILKSIFEVDDLKEIPIYVFTNEDWKHIDKIAQEYYENWDWNYGASPDFNTKYKHRFPTGSVDVRLLIKGNTIEQAHFYGDFFGSEDVEKIAKALEGCAYSKEAIMDCLADIPVELFFGSSVTKEEVADLILGNLVEK